MSAPKFTGYEVTSEGRVFSISGWRGIARRELAQDLNSHGYPRVRVMVYGARRVRLVHVLVAEAFLGPRPSPKHEVRHLDGNKTNNNFENLAWGTRKENAADRARHGRTRNGWMAGTVDREKHRRGCVEAARRRSP